MHEPGNPREPITDRDIDTPDTESSVDGHIKLLDLDEAVALLGGAYARRTLQNLAWAGKVRHVGCGQRMRFVARWLIDDLAAAPYGHPSHTQGRRIMEFRPGNPERRHDRRVCPKCATRCANRPTCPARGRDTKPRIRVVWFIGRTCHRRLASTWREQNARAILQGMEADYWRRQRLDRI